MKTAFLFIPDPVYTSDIIRTKYLQELSKYMQVVVLLPLNVREITELQYPQSNMVKYLPWPKETVAWVKLKILRLLAINEFDYLKNTTALVERQVFANKKGWKGSALYYAFRSIAAVGIRIKADLFTWLEVRYAPTRSSLFVELLKKYKPDIMLTPTPGFMKGEAEMIILAKRNNIPTVAIDFSWDNLSSKAMRIRKTDHLIVWNSEIQKEAYSIHGYKPKDVSVVGIMRFDHYFRREMQDMSRESFLRGKGLDPRLKTILISTCSPGVFKGHIEIIRDIIAWSASGQLAVPVNILVRLHPKDLSDYGEFKGIPNVWVEKGFTRYKFSDRWEDGFLEMNEADLENMKNTLRHCDININCASTVTLEAASVDMPIINIYVSHYYGRYHYKPIVESGAVSMAKLGEEMRQAINRYLTDPTAEKAERAALTKRYIEFTDGQSYRRNAEVISRLLDEKTADGSGQRT